MSALLCTNTRLAGLLQHVLSDMLLQTYNGSAPHTLFSERTTHPSSLVLRLIALNIDLDATVCTCERPPPPYCRCAPPLHRAITHSNKRMVAVLLRHGASITAQCPSTGHNAVHQAIHTIDLNSGHFQIARDNDVAILALLLSGGRLKTMNSPAALSADGQSWLSTAVRKCPRSSVGLVMPFLVRGLDVNVADSRGLTPLHVAVWNNRPDLAKMLLQRGANHRTVDDRGKTPWTTAVNRPNCELIHLLLGRDAGLIRNPVNAMGDTALVCLERSLDDLLRNEDTEGDYWGREVAERTGTVERMARLASVSKRAFGVRVVLQAYYLRDEFKVYIFGV